MKGISEVNDKRFIHRRGRGILLPLIALLLLLLLVACAGGQGSTPTSAPVETAIVDATPTLAQPTASPTQAPATSTAAPAETATATAAASPSPTATEDAANGVQEWTTYEDNVAHFALDYPATWHVIDVAQEDKIGLPGYILTFLSWDPAEGMEGIPEGESIVEANVQPKGDASLEEAAESLKSSLGPSERVLSESTVSLDSGLPAIRWLLETRAGPTHMLLTVIGERPILLRGWGDEGIFDVVAGSLRSTYTHADDAQRIVFAPGATSATVEGSFSGQAQARYLFWAAAGQVVSLSVTSPQNSTLFHLEGVQDGEVYKHLLDGENSWQGTLTVSQDYLLTIDNSDMPAQYTIELSIVDV